MPSRVWFAPVDNCDADVKPYLTALIGDVRAGSSSSKKAFPQITSRLDREQFNAGFELETPWSTVVAYECFDADSSTYSALSRHTA